MKWCSGHVSTATGSVLCLSWYCGGLSRGEDLGFVLHFYIYFTKGPNDRHWILQPPPLWVDTLQEWRLEWLWLISCDHQYLVSMHTICNKHNLYLVAVPASLPRGAATPPPRLPLTCTSSPARPWTAPTPSSLAPSSRGGGQCWRCSWLFSLEIPTTGQDNPRVDEL